MLKRVFVFLVCMSVAAGVLAQGEKRIDITSFEEPEYIDAWRYGGGNIVESYVLEAADLPQGVKPVDGNNVLYVAYDNNGSAWQWCTMSFAFGSIDLTGMREIHMWVYFLPDSVPDPEDGYEIRLDLPGGANLGYRSTQNTGEWVEFVWNIDRLTSEERASDVSYWGGFIGPDPGEVRGALYIDNIYALRPAGIPELVTLPLYGFNEEDPQTGTPLHWTSSAGTAPALGQDETDPSEGSNYMVIYLGGGWIQNVETVDAMADFARWPEVMEIMVDVMVGPDYTGSWVQSALILQSGVTGVEDAPNVSGWDGYPELGYSEARDAWKLILWEVDMSRHKGAFGQEGGWFSVSLSTNNDANQEGASIFFDNMRVSVPKVTRVADWSLF